MEIPFAFGYTKTNANSFEFKSNRRPVLAVVGSRNAVSGEQVKSAETGLNMHVIHTDPTVFVDSRGRLTRLGKLIKEVTDFIDHDIDILVTTSFSRYIPALKETSARLLSRIAAETVKQCELSGLFLTGGDIAGETCHALGCSGLKILKELEPGVVLSQSIGAQERDVKIVTKAGGFGKDRTIVDSVRYLRGDRR